MKILMQSRTNFYTKPGGDTIQLLKTKEYLEKIGVRVDISLKLSEDLEQYDLVHLSNLTRVHETFFQLKEAKKQNKKVLLSTIYWPTNELEKEYSSIRYFITKYLGLDFLEKLKAIYRVFFLKEFNRANLNACFVSYSKMQKYILDNTNYFLPNSLTEMTKLNEVFNMDIINFSVIPNAIDVQNLGTPLLKEFEKYKDYILCVGRLDARKNQLNLLKALEGTDYKVLLVGSKGNKLYTEKIDRILEKNSNFEWVERIDNKNLYALYKTCKLHILPSWFDTPGLVSLEAAGVGAKIVASTKGTTKDYFKDFIEYCEPDSLESIRVAIEKTEKSLNNCKLKEHILENYTWDKAAQKTKEAYIKVMNGK
ncbi:glycosyltransferase [Cetobacterium sp. ZWU0022]|uniref:glycosyltransferase n=1 Tax=Cetobacterium sp. ZWU0022 TaxID=1340502 RepID=UPI00064786C5|nr:glycosyltransferase [Cetobacterium sp. ZWU0022]